MPNHLISRILCVLACASSALLCTALGAQAVDLTKYYRPIFREPGVTFEQAFPYFPQIDFVGNAIRPSIIDRWNFPYLRKTIPGPYFPGGLVGFAYNDYVFYLGPYREGVCNVDFIIPMPPLQGQVVTMEHHAWRTDGTDGSVYDGMDGVCDDFSGAPITTYPHRFTDDQLTIGAPIRRTAIDGSQYDASPLKVTRNGLPWYTVYMGYRLSLVAHESNWDDANRDKAGDLVGFFRLPTPDNNFNLVALPPPWVEDDVVEYVNRREFPNQPDGQFFYAVLASDKALLDTLPNWSRTGKSFKSGGYVTVCRFYGGKNGGPNTHFYSADDKECEALKQNPRLSYEGQTFAVNVAMPAKTAEQQVPGALRDCPRDSVPLYRLYNNASASNGRFVSNHRYTTDRADVAAFVAKGWVDEGHAMCVPR